MFLEKVRLKEYWYIYIFQTWRFQPLFIGYVFCPTKVLKSQEKIHNKDVFLMKKYQGELVVSTRLKNQFPKQIQCSKTTT